jgi:hypothetical protein
MQIAPSISVTSCNNKIRWKRFGLYLVLGWLVICAACGPADTPEATVKLPKVNASPSSGEGPQVVISVTVTPTGQLQTVGVLYNQDLDGRGACYLLYNIESDVFTLINDAGDAGKILPSPGASVENSQCAVAPSNTTTENGHHRVNLRLAITFKPAFAGPKNVYVYTVDKTGKETGFQQQGTWMVVP